MRRSRWRDEVDGHGLAVAVAVSVGFREAAVGTPVLLIRVRSSGDIERRLRRRLEFARCLETSRIRPLAQHTDTSPATATAQQHITHALRLLQARLDPLRRLRAAELQVAFTRQRAQRAASAIRAHEADRVGRGPGRLALCLLLQLGAGVLVAPELPGAGVAAAAAGSAPQRRRTVAADAGGEVGEAGGADAAGEGEGDGGVVGLGGGGRRVRW